MCASHLLYLVRYLFPDLELQSKMKQRFFTAYNLINYCAEPYLAV